MQADSRCQGWWRFWTRCPPQEEGVELLVTAWLECGASSPYLICLRPHLLPMLLSPRMALPGPVTLQAYVHALPCALLATARKFLLSLQYPARRSFLWPSQAQCGQPLSSDPRTVFCVGVCHGHSSSHWTAGSGVPAPGPRPPFCFAPVSSSTSAPLLTS